MEIWRIKERLGLRKGKNVNPREGAKDREYQAYSKSVKAVIDALKDAREDVRIRAMGDFLDSVVSGKVNVREKELSEINKHYDKEDSDEVREMIIRLNVHAGNLSFVEKKLETEHPELVKNVLLKLADEKNKNVKRLATHVINNRKEKPVLHSAITAIKIGVPQASMRRGRARPAV